MEVSETTNLTGGSARIKITSDRSRKVAERLTQLRRRTDSNAIISSNEEYHRFVMYICNFIKPLNPRFDIWTSDHWILAGYIILLVISTSIERVTFKMSVDDMTPFRYLLILAMLLCSAIAYAIISFAKRSTLVKELSYRFC